MKTNMGKLDRGGRLAVAALLVILAVSGTLTGALFGLALVVAAVFTLTAFMGNCPLYSLVGLKTCRDC